MSTLYTDTRTQFLFHWGIAGVVPLQTLSPLSLRKICFPFQSCLLRTCGTLLAATFRQFFASCRFANFFTLTFCTTRSIGGNPNKKILRNISFGFCLAMMRFGPGLTSVSTWTKLEVVGFPGQRPWQERYSAWTLLYSLCPSSTMAKDFQSIVP